MKRLLIAAVLICLGIVFNVGAVYADVPCLTYDEIPCSSDAVSYDQKILKLENKGGCLWADRVYSQEQINAQASNQIKGLWIANNLSYTLASYPRESNHFVLPILNRGALNFAIGNYRDSFKYFYNAKDVMKSMHQKGFSLGQEQSKIFKGEAYEQSLAALYLGLILYMDGDYQNARAMFAQSIELDRETIPVMEDLEDLAKKYDRKKKNESDPGLVEVYKGLGNDNRLAYYMLSRAYMKLGEPENAAIALRNSQNWLEVPDMIKEDSCGKAFAYGQNFDQAPPSGNSFANLDALENHNLVVLIQMGFAPQKYLAGMQGRNDYIKPRFYPERKAEVYIDGKLVSQSYPLYNLYHQAMCTPRTTKDTAQLGKAIGKTICVLAAACVSDDLSRTVDNKWSVAADTRRWGTAPNEIHLASGQVSPGLHTLTVLFYDQAGNPLRHYEQTKYFVPVKENDETLIVLRAIKDKGNTLNAFDASKVIEYNADKAQIVFKASDLKSLHEGKEVNIFTIDFGSEALNQGFIERQHSQNQGVQTVVKGGGFFTTPKVDFSYDEFKPSEIRKVGTAKIDQISWGKAKCSVVNGNLSAGQTLFVTTHDFIKDKIIDYSNHDRLGNEADNI